MCNIKDDLDRVIQIRQRASSTETAALTYEFVYDGEGNLYELRNYKTNRATFLEYDRAGHCMSIREKTFTTTGGAVSYTGTSAFYQYEYGANNNVLFMRSCKRKS